MERSKGSMKLINLTLDEIKEVTGKSHRNKQAIVLSVMQIPFKMRPDGSILVSREAYQLAMGCDLITEPQAKTVKPNFAAVQ